MRKMKRTVVAAFCLCSAFVITPAHVTLRAQDKGVEQTVRIQETGEEDDTYKCGDYATWSFDQSTKTLTIEGKGRIEQVEEWDKLGIKKIVIKKGIKCIGTDSFEQLDDLEEVVIPDSVKAIRYGAFAYCKKLKKFEIPSGVETLSTFSFYRTGCEKVTVPKTVKNMGSYVFSECHKLKEAQFLADCSAYGDFQGCISLSKVSVNCTEISNRMFAGCKSLTKIELMKPVKKIGYSAFERTGLTQFKIPSSVTSISWGVFNRCKDLEKLTIGKGVKGITHGFEGSGHKNLTVILEEGTRIVPKGLFRYSDVKKVVLPSTIKEIGSYAFANMTMDSIKLPASVTEIGSYAFADSDISSVAIPDRVKMIRYKTFYKCQKLKRVKFGKRVWRIGESAFQGCRSLNEVTIPGTVKTIGYCAFKQSGLKKVVIPDGVVNIEYWAFHECSKLRSVTIGKTAKMIKHNAFVECKNLTSIKVNPSNKAYTTQGGVLYNKSMSKLISCPAGKKGTFTVNKKVRSFSDYAFYGCKYLKAFKVEDGNRHISTHDGIIYNKAQTELLCVPIGKRGNIVIPRGVKFIKEYAFQNSKASNVKFPNTLKTIGRCAFEECYNLKEITIPSSVKTISEAAFWECTNLVRVNFKEGVKTIKANAFYECSGLRIVKIPNSVKKIAGNAFYGCKYAITIYCEKYSYANDYAKRHYIDVKYI